MQQQNALIGVQVAAFYPDISLSTLGGFIGSPLSQLFTMAQSGLVVGRRGERDTVRGRRAFGRSGGGACDLRPERRELSAGRADRVPAGGGRIVHLCASWSSRRRARGDRGERLRNVPSTSTLNAYRAGTVAYTSVITEQTTLLSATSSRQLAVQQSRLVASVALIAALGGGWDAQLLAEAGR